MKGAVKTQRRKRAGLVATGGAPAAQADDERTAEPPSEPDSLAAENQRPLQTDIERVDEHRAGSVEAAPHPEPEDGITGFLEPASDQNLEPTGR